MPFSKRVHAYLSDPSVPVSPWSTEMLAEFEAEHGPLHEKHRDFEQSLFEATGGRGLPVLAGFTYGIVAAQRKAPPGTPLVVEYRDRKSTLMAWSIARGVGLYLGPRGHVKECGLIVTGIVGSFIERQIIELSQPWSAVSLRILSPCGQGVAEALGVPPTVEASDDWISVWDGRGYVICEDTDTTRVRFVNPPAAKRVLALCAEKGDRVYCESTAPSELTGGGGEASDDLEHSADYRRDGFVTVLAHVEPNAVVDAWVHAGRVLQTRTFTEDATVIRSLRASTSVCDHLSARALAFLDEGVVLRDPARRCDRGTLERELVRCGITHAPEALFELERDFGGLLFLDYNTAIPAWTMGAYMVLSAAADVIQHFRWDTSEPGEEDPEDPDTLTKDVWPRVRWQSLALYPVGDEFRGWDCEVHLYLDEAGVMYRYTGMFDELKTAAGSARAFIEQDALRGEASKRFSEWSPATVEGDVGDVLASRLGLQRVAEASDAIASSWLGDDFYVRAWADYGPTRARAEIVSLTPDAMVRAVTLAHELAPDALIRVRHDLAGGHAREAALLKAGLPLKR